MEFLSIELTGIISGLSKPVAARISNFWNLDERVHTLRAEIKKLKDTRDDLKRCVDQAELNGLTARNQVKWWLEEVQAIEDEVSVMEERFRQQQQRRCVGCCHANCSSRYKLSTKVAKKLRGVGELVDRGTFDTVADSGSPPDAVKEIPTRPMYGLDVMLEKVRQFLADDAVGIIGIYGMGGVGKTALLKNINNEFLTKTHDFDVVIWVLVSKDFVADKIQQAVGARLGLSWEEDETQEQRALKICRVMRRKRFLLLLDDVWEELDLENIGIPLADQQNKCKVIFTTRSMDVCSDMDAHRKLKVEFLEEKESWQLFQEKVGQKELLDLSSIRPHAEKIVKKCGGLPLALITIGRAMANKETEEEWKYAIELLDNSPSELRGMEDVFTLLKFSYDNLDNDTLRSCFLYCSLFPEDFSIEKEQLVEYWVGEGFLDSSHDGNVQNKGHAVIGSLKVACLLENGEEKTQVKMHDVVRSFALWISSGYGRNEKKFLIQPSIGLTEAPRVENWRFAERISLLDNGITALSEIPDCPSLSTLLLQWNSGLNRITVGFFHFMPVLRVLDLSFTSLKEIPVSIGELVELRHLDLSGTKLTALPKELGSLAKLRLLDLQRTHSLRTIPHEAISRLSQLRVLNFYYSYGGWEALNCDAPESDASFADLEGLRHLSTLGITVIESTTLRRLSRLNTLLKCIKYLYIKECEGLFYLQFSSASGDGKKLRRLSINNSYDLKYLAIGEGAGRNWLPSLEVLSLHGLPNLTRVWRNSVTRECLQNLRSISIWYCHKLKNVSWILQLPRLEVLYIFYCSEMEELICGDEMIEEDLMAFPSLRTMSIRDLPQLRSISQEALAFPSLERIAVMDCPKLKKLPLKTHGVSALPRVYGSKEWWHGLEWDEGAATNSAILPPFMAT